MASLRVFVSSTCYDLAVVRGQLRQFIASLGHEPILSEYNDVLYDPNTHTHVSCVREVSGADAVVLVIGSRFGGTAIPEALKTLDFEALMEMSKSNDFLKDPKRISVTQLEVLKAIQTSVPVFVFVEDRVLNDHATYERNKMKPIIDEIEFSSIDKPETAKYVFSFINFLRQRGVNNAVFPFSRLQDIEETLKRQWSALLQQLLSDSKTRQVEAKRIDDLTEQLEDLKTAILTEVGGNKNQLEVARGVVRFRRLIDFVRGFNPEDYEFLWGPSLTWAQFMKHLGIKEIVPAPPGISQTPLNATQRDPTYYIKEDQTFFSVDRNFDGAQMEEEWKAFMALSSESRKVISDALFEIRPSIMLTRRLIVYHNIKLPDYVNMLRNGEKSAETIAKEENEWLRAAQAAFEISKVG